MSSPTLAVQDGGRSDVDDDRNIYASIAKQADIQIEQSLLGLLLMYNDHYFKTADILDASDFSEAVHGRLYAAIARIIDDGGVATPISLRSRFENDGDLSDVGGAEYLGSLVSAVSSPDAVYQAGRILERSKRRQMMQTCYETFTQIAGLDGDVASDLIIERAQHDFFTASDRSAGRRVVSYAEAVAQALDTIRRGQAGEIETLTTGLAAFNRCLGGGMHDTDLMILGGRPGMGKTLVAMAIAEACAKRALDPNRKDGAAVGMFSMEMTSEQLAMRALSAAAYINSETIRQFELNERQQQEIQTVQGPLSRLPIHIDDSAGLTAKQICVRARMMSKRNKIGLLVIDNLNTIKYAGRNRVQEVGEAVGAFKNLAKELAIPVLVLSQLSRKIEDRTDKRPILADLRESGDIEQTADHVIFVYRPAYYLEQSKPEAIDGGFADWETKIARDQNKLHLLVRKNRHGPLAELEFEVNIKQLRVWEAEL